MLGLKERHANICVVVNYVDKTYNVVVVVVVVVVGRPAMPIIDKLAVANV